MTWSAVRYVCPGLPLWRSKPWLLARSSGLAIVWAIVFVMLATSHSQQVHGQDVYFGEDDFDKVTFSRMTQLEARQKCEEALQQTVQRIQATIELSEEHREKLLTAGHLDVHRFFADYDSTKRMITFGNVRRDQWQQVSTAAHASVHSLSRQFLQGLFAEGSLFDKTLNTILDADEVEQVMRANDAFSQAAYGDQIDMAMLVIGRQVRLTPEKKTTIREKLLARD